MTPEQYEHIVYHLNEAEWAAREAKSALGNAEATAIRATTEKIMDDYERLMKVSN